MHGLPICRTGPNRRALLRAGAVGAVALAGGAWSVVAADRFDGAALPPPEVLEAMRAGRITLVDIRRPDEWDRTGVAADAVPLDMRREDFVDALLAQVGGAEDASIALICARGVRSDRMSARLADAGFTQVIDVPEGMLGSAAGPGWLARGLPVERR